MSRPKPDDLLAKLRDEIQALESETLKARSDYEFAKNRAHNQEEFNRQATFEMEQQVESARKKLMSGIDKEVLILRSEVDKLKKAKSTLQTEIVKLNQTKETIESKATSVESEFTLLTVAVSNLKAEKKSLIEELEASKLDLATLQEQKASLELVIIDLRHRNQDILQETNILQTEVDNLEEQIMELDTQHKARKEVYAKQQTESQLKLKNTLESLTEAQNKDKEFRKGWAEQKLDLERREGVVRRMESRLSDTEKRIQELDNYSKL